MTRATRLRGAAWLGLRQLRAAPTRTALAVVGVALAVLAATLLVGVGVGVAETGEATLDRSERDLWVAGGPVELAPETVGGVRNPVVDAHELAAEIEAREDVRSAVPIGVQVLYVGTEPDDVEPVLATGTPGLGSSVSVEAGEGFSGEDTHRAGGSYDGPMTGEVLVDPGTAERLGVEPGDTLYVGGSVAGAGRNEFTVVGVSPTFAAFTGSETVTLRLSELQTLTGSAGEDRATVVAVNLVEGADVEAARSEIQREHPEYEVRTNREQFAATLRRHAVAVAGGLSVAAVGLLAGAAFALTMQLSLVARQREAFGVLRAVGASWSTLATVAAVQTAVVVAAGSALGLAATPPLAALLDVVVAAQTGFEGLVRAPTDALLAGAGVAATFGTLGCALAIRRLRTLAAPTALEGA